MRFLNQFGKSAMTVALLSVAQVLWAGSGIFVRGTVNNWNCESAFEFVENGNGTYTLHLDQLSGHFKIATSDWNILDLGIGPKEDNPYTLTTGNTLMTPEGNNIYVESASDVNLTLTVKENGSYYLSATGNGIPEGNSLNLSGTLPILYIDTDPVMISKDLDDKEYRTGTYWLDANGCDWAETVGSADNMLPLNIKARGNWTRKGFAKKPFKLKLDKKQSLCGLTKSKHFAILAHADDPHSYLRNFVGFNLGRRIGLPWTPDQQPIEVVINGDYRGIYFLTESIRIEEQRVNIAELKDNETDPALCSGGYLIELDNYEEGDQIIEPEWNGNDVMRVTFDTPEVYSALQRQFIEDQFKKMNSLVQNHDPELWSYMDLDMAARYYIVEEIIDHRESYHGSTYMYRDRGDGQKWIFSPLWDCGAAFGRADVEGYFSDALLFGNLWIANMRQTPGFMDKVQETWKWFWGTCVGDNGSEIFSDIDSYLTRIEKAAVADHTRWANAPLPSFEGASPVVNNSDLNPGRSWVRQCLERKTNWLKQQWGEPSANAVEPTHDTTPAAPLPEYVTSSVESLPAVPADIDAMFNLQGVRLESARKGDVVIIVSGGRAVKTVL